MLSFMLVTRERQTDPAEKLFQIELKLAFYFNHYVLICLKHPFVL